MGRKPKEEIEDEKDEEIKPKRRGRPPKSEKEHILGVSQETRNSIWGVLSFSVALVSTLSFIGKAGQAGEIFNLAARSLFGWGFFIIPVALVMLGSSFFKSISRKVAVSAVFGTILFILTFLGILFILGNGETDLRIAHGGYLGVVLGYPLFASIGFTASAIILFALGIIAVLMVLDISILSLFVAKKDEEKLALTDNVVVKKGNEIIDALKKPEAKPMPAAAAKPAKAEPMSDKEFVIKNLKHGKWTLPPLDLLHEDQEEAVTGDINASATIIKRTLSNFGIDVEMGEVSIGPTVTQYTLRPAVGVKLSRIGALNSDLSLALAAHPIRIEAPIPGKSLVGIEVPNQKFAIIGLRDMFESDEYKKSKYFLPLALGRDVSGTPIFAGLEKMPHMLVAGATGTGKSVAINAILLSLLYKHSPDVLKLILVDPKRVELSLYNEIPHLITPVITDNKKVVGALKWAVNEMDRRYDQLSKIGSKDVFSYNAKMTDKGDPIMPFIVIVIDELADLMSSYGRDVEAAIVRLAQMSRAVGIHLILSTQRPSVEVITGLIKANITSRVALQVASQIDSRTILDMAGAEKLLGKGDMLFLSGDTAKPRRIQGALVTEDEVHDVVKFIREQGAEMEVPADAPSLQVDFNAPASGAGGSGGDDDGGDEMYGQAKEIVIQTQKASTSYLQRRLGLGYTRAARLLDLLEQNGVVGPANGAKPRDVYVRPDGTMDGPVIPEVDAAIVSADTPEADRTNS
ncbi:MAG TPA: DNA translocase FtsK 4TM domain-containing protein [Candidatus Paceibacterota bacterium]|nr:DNA translocase FtsK 4TM domain-containing protein [Candidatus Paceibacterota bacterium]